ncbi:MAG: hypothetical protein KDD15_32065 [Lewinella sp.]|nr:hypothetical protein [Lewinella sp.]
MDTQEAQISMQFPPDQPQTGPPAHRVLDLAPVEQLIRAFMPELLRAGTEANGILDAIAAFLEPGNRRIFSPWLERLLPEELYTALCGLKMLLRKRNWNIAEWILEDSKARFGELIRESLEEE